MTAQQLFCPTVFRENGGDDFQFRRIRARRHRFFRGVIFRTSAAGNSGSQHQHYQKKYKNTFHRYNPPTHLNISANKKLSVKQKKPPKSFDGFCNKYSVTVQIFIQFYRPLLKISESRQCFIGFLHSHYNTPVKMSKQASAQTNRKRNYTHYYSMLLPAWGIPVNSSISLSNVIKSARLKSCTEE